MKVEMIGEVPGNILGMMADCCHKIQHGKITSAEFGLFLKRKNPFGKNEVEINVVRIAVDPDAPLDYDKTRDGWKYLSDVKEPTGELALELVEFLKEGETFIKGEELVKRAKEKHILLGQRHAEALLKNQGAIPKEWRKYYLIFPGSVLQDPSGSRHVPYLYWDGDRWCLDFSWFVLDFRSFDRLVGSRK